MDSQTRASSRRQPRPIKPARLWRVFAILFPCGLLAAGISTGQSIPTLILDAGQATAPQVLVVAPLGFANGGHAITAIAFSLDLDPTGLTFDDTDQDLDGVPDAVTLPAGMPQILVHVVDCPEIKVRGVGGARVLPLSRRAFLGVEASNLTPELREHFGAPADAGVLLSRIVEDSAAEVAGLSVGDVVTHIDGDEITSPNELGRVIRRQQGGDVVEIEYWRDGENSYATVTLDEKEGCSIDIGDPLRSLRLEDLSALGELGVEIGSEALESTLEGLGEALANQDWEKHFQGLEDIEFEHLEERMEHVQERLERLEERLERDFGRKVERAEREMERARERAERERRREIERVEKDAERRQQEAEREIERAEREAERQREEAEREREQAERERERAEREQRRSPNGTANVVV